MIAIVDYGAGNLTSVKKALDWLGQASVVTSEPEFLAEAKKIILPGVGHFSATSALARTGLRDAIADAINREIPFLGICVGMQWMFEGSRESPQTPGLGFFRGECERFPPSVKSPHVGWNEIHVIESSKLLRGLTASPYLYFTHSFRVPPVTVTTACCDYGGRFSAAVERGFVFGVQFHPEKSGAVGLKLLSNFCAF